MANSNSSTPNSLSASSGIQVKILDGPTEADKDVLAGYAHWANKGSLTDGARLTLLTAKTSYPVGTEVRVLHLAEITEPGHQVYIMGPKTPFDEYVNDQLATKPLPKGDNPLEPASYDGRTLPSPASDTNYAVTAYQFSRPGTYHLQWRPGGLKSNRLTLEITSG